MGILACVASVGAWGCDGAGTEPSTIETKWGDMPNVVGMPAQEAWAALVGAGFFPQFERADAEGEPGRVATFAAEEMPDAVSLIRDANGEIHEEYDNVSWKASAVCGLCEMSQVPLQLTFGNSEAEARAQLEEAGIAEVEVTRVGNVDDAANVVTEVSPGLGVWVVDGEPVTITVTSDVTMPDVLGDDPFTAQTRLLELGLEPEPLITELSGLGDFVPAVDGASAEPGEPLRVGDVVELSYTTAL